MDKFLPFTFALPVFVLGIIYIYLEANKMQRQELTSSQISFLLEAAKGSQAAERLVNESLGSKLSPREYANLRCQVDVIVSSEQKNKCSAN